MWSWWLFLDKKIDFYNLNLWLLYNNNYKNVFYNLKIVMVFNVKISLVIYSFWLFYHQKNLFYNFKIVIVI